MPGSLQCTAVAGAVNAAAEDDWTATDEEELMQMIEQELLAAAAAATTGQQQEQRELLLPPLQGYPSVDQWLAAEGLMSDTAGRSLVANAATGCYVTFTAPAVAGQHGCTEAAAAAGVIANPMAMVQGAAAQGQYNNSSRTAVEYEALTARYAAIQMELQLLERLHASL
jgi:hypothetical protein